MAEAMRILPVARTVMCWFLFGTSVGICTGSSVQLSLDGDWQFTYTRSTSERIPSPPPSAAYDVTVQIPGWWDQQLDRMRKASWFGDAEFRETQGPVKYL